VSVTYVFADRHVFPIRPAAIEMMRDGSTTSLRHEGFQANHFLPGPRSASAGLRSLT
jgi:hypothetical protein